MFGTTIRYHKSICRLSVLFLSVLPSTWIPFVTFFGHVSAIAAGSFKSPPAELYSPLVAKKVLKVAQSSFSPALYPQYTDQAAGDWIWFTPDQWTSGFFPATLYAMHDRASLCPSPSNAAEWLSLGRTWAAAEIPLEARTSVGHDVGFLSFPFMDELAVNPNNETAIQAVNAFAKQLALRFNPTVGCTSSWDSVDPTDFQVIIDNMMNLEVLFASEKLTGNRTLREIAISHADKTMANHIRPDGGSFHLVEYNSTTGDVIKRSTIMGYADSSTWSRGESWALYGFANMHKHTKKYDYLETARRAATYFLANLPDDGVVPWDFDAPPVPPRPADSSAAMIAANALLLLADQEHSIHNDTGAAYYTHAAIQLIHDNMKLAWAPSWQSLLSNGTVDKPSSNYWTGIVYGDYYFIKAGNELLSRGLAHC